MSIDFEIPAEAKAIREKVRKWVHDECIPAEKELDTKPLEEVLGKLRKKARAQGLWCPFVPKEYGGMGLGPLANALVQMELGESMLGALSMNTQGPDDADIMSAVNSALSGSGLTGTFVPGACLAPTDGNGINNKPYSSAAFPGTTQRVNVHICYSPPGGGPQLGTLAAHPTDNSWRLGDINVSVLMNFGIITPFIQSIFGSGLNLAYNEHFTIQGKP